MKADWPNEPFFHGGPRTFGRGRLLLPPTRTGARSGAEFGGEGVCRRDRVYITNELLYARVFALLAPPKGHGSVYEVEPIGETEPDPDYSGPGLCLEVPEARVLRIVEKRVTQVQGLGMREVAAILTEDADPYPPALRLATDRPDLQLIEEESRC